MKKKLQLKRISGKFANNLTLLKDVHLAINVNFCMKSILKKKRKDFVLNLILLKVVQKVKNAINCTKYNRLKMTKKIKSKSTVNIFCMHLMDALAEKLVKTCMMKREKNRCRKIKTEKIRKKKKSCMKKRIINLKITIKLTSNRIKRMTKKKKIQMKNLIKRLKKTKNKKRINKKRLVKKKKR